MLALINGQNYQRGRRISTRVRAALIILLYKKTLSVDLCALGGGVGAVNNLISVDVSEVEELACFAQMLWSSVFESTVCMGLLFIVLGPAALGGICVMLVAIPIGSYGTIKLDNYQRNLLKDKDNRISVVQEAIQGIRIVKWFAWEEQFMEKICQARSKEISSLRSYLIIDALLRINWGLVPTLVGLVSFLVHTIVLGKSLSPAVGFTSILLFNLLRWPLTTFPDMVNSLVRARVSMKRINEYLDSKNVNGLSSLEEKKDTLSASANDRNGAVNIASVLEKENMISSPTEANDVKCKDEYGIHFLDDDNRHDVDDSSATVTINGASFGWNIQSNIDDNDRKISHKKKNWISLNRCKFRNVSTNSEISVTGNSDNEDCTSESDEDDFADEDITGIRKVKEYSGIWGR